MIKNRSALSNLQIMARQHDGRWRWIGLLLALIAITSVSLSACSTAAVEGTKDPAALPAEISVEEAYRKYQEGVFLLDVRTQEEWDDFHAPNTTLIPLDQLEDRLNELPQNEEIVVVCRSGNRSQAGRDILRNGGFEQSTSMSGGLNAWRAAGYPIE
jgi:rhodanese-related sulfurtransferase